MHGTQNQVSSRVWGNPLLPHRQIERLLEKSGTAWTHLRPNDFMQNLATVQCAPKARITSGGGFHPESCRLLW